MKVVYEEVTHKGIYRYHGSIGPIPCPHCDKEEIELTENQSGGHSFWLTLAMLGPLGWLASIGILSFLGIGTRWLLHCRNCGYYVDLSDTERVVADKRVEIVKNYEAGRMDEEAFRFQLKESSCPVLDRLEEESLHWQCQDCEKMIPQNFPSCWNCGAPQPDFIGEDVEPNRTAVQGHYDPVFGTQAIVIQEED